MALGPILLTGAAGTIGSRLRAPLREAASELRLTDVAPLAAEAENESVHPADLTDLGALRTAADGVEAVVHLGGVPVEAPFEELAPANLVGCYHAYEAARLGGASRFVFASSNHATGFYPPGHRLVGDEPPRPDSLYGVSKVYGEALGRLYHDKFGLRVACLRIGSFQERPRDPRMLHTWLSVPDAVRLVLACLTSPDLHFAVLYGVSANRRSWWAAAPGRRLGYEPQDDAEGFAAELGEPDGETPQGGQFTARDRHASRSS
jgi:uronate dehydrogenase